MTPHWLQIISWVANVCLAGIAGYAVIFARQQVLAAREANVNAIKYGEVNLLIDLDKRWESQEMHESREIIRKMRRSVREQITSEYEHLNEESKHQKRKELYCEVLFELRENGFDEYQHFMRVWGFLETVGYCVKAKHLSLNDIDEIFGAVVLQIDEVSHLHIRERDEKLTQDIGKPAQLYENMLNIARELGAKN